MKYESRYSAFIQHTKYALITAKAVTPEGRLGDSIKQDMNCQIHNNFMVSQQPLCWWALCKDQPVPQICWNRHMADGR